MLIDHENKIVVPKAFKVAGSSMQTYFSQHCSGERFEIFDKHRTFEQIKSEYNLDEEYKKIILIRNPWDYLVSAFFWARNNRECLPGNSFLEFLYKENKFNWKKQKKFWKLNYFYYIKFEELPNSFYNFCNKFNIPGNSKLGHEKKSSSRQDYKFYFINDNDVDYINEFFKEYINEFNYEF